jgi:pilus assembly protein Flp/PilA
MARLSPLLQRFSRDERGVSSIEYALIATIISIVAVGYLTTIGIRVNAMTNGVTMGLPP